ncbi:MAG: three-Cys-motif partner protein TcmP [Candidatus Bathyarchaeia archaeon]
MDVSLPKKRYNISDYLRWVIPLTLEFVGDAISLSGLTGTRLKCDVIGTYYPFWWRITSGGKWVNFRKPTSIVELNAATGEVYVKDTGETVLGSAGHALEIKVNHMGEQNIDTSNLKVILVEDNQDCYFHLKRVINKRWKEIDIEESESSISENSSNVYLFNDTLDGALKKIVHIDLGNAIFYFDPLRSVRWKTVESVAKSRMLSPFQTGTEFIIFLFTSDWFLGRDGFSPLPNNLSENSWTSDEHNTVLEADSLFGGRKWRKSILNRKGVTTKEKMLLELYIRKLSKWFRYVLPMPFIPKKNQLFHLILCSNYETGVAITKGAYTSKTLNQPYTPDNKVAYNKFIMLHPETKKNLKGNRRPLKWKLLWKVIKQHEGNTCDSYCKDFQEEEPDTAKIQSVLEWLKSQGYLLPLNIESAWDLPIYRYKLNWKIIEQNLGINPPSELEPLSPKEFAKTELGKTFEVMKKWSRGFSKSKMKKEE